MISHDLIRLPAPLDSPQIPKYRQIQCKSSRLPNRQAQRSASSRLVASARKKRQRGKVPSKLLAFLTALPGSVSSLRSSWQCSNCSQS